MSEAHTTPYRDPGLDLETHSTDAATSPTKGGGALGLERKHHVGNLRLVVVQSHAGCEGSPLEVQQGLPIPKE